MESSSEHPPVLVADPVLGGGGGVALLAAGQLTVRGLAHTLERRLVRYASGLFYSNHLTTH